MRELIKLIKGITKLSQHQKYYDTLDANSGYVYRSASARPFTRMDHSPETFNLRPLVKIYAVCTSYMYIYDKMVRTRLGGTF